MNSIISSISAFIQKTLAIAVLGSGILLFAGEIRLAALKKASQGSSKLSSFTVRMTGITIHNKNNKLREYHAKKN